MPKNCSSHCISGCEYETTEKQKTETPIKLKKKEKAIAIFKTVITNIIRSMKKHFLAFTAIAITFSSCKKENTHTQGTTNADYINATDCSGSSPTYTANVQPILDTKCATSGCHDIAFASGGLALEGYDSTKTHFNQHKILCAINHNSDCGAMPKSQPKLADTEIKTITCWAKNSFPN